MATQSSKVNTPNQETNFKRNDNKNLEAKIGDVVGQGKVEDIKARATEGLESARQYVGDFANTARETAVEYAENAGEYVKRYPIQSIVVGFGLGLLVGALLSPKRLY